MIGSLIKYRRFIWKQAVADLRHRYAGTGMGVAWNVIHPLGVILVYSLVFSTIMHVELPQREGAPEPSGMLGYTIYLCTGLFPWMAFSDCILRGCNAFVVNANYLKRLAIPEVVFVAQSVVSIALSLAINYSLLLVLAAMLRHHVFLSWLLLPLPLVMLLALGFGIGFLLGTLNVFFRDIAEWVAIFLPIIMWTVPVVYVVDGNQLPHWLTAAYFWHPIYPALQLTRGLFGEIEMPRGGILWLFMFAWPAAIISLAIFTFAKVGRELRDLV